MNVQQKVLFVDASNGFYAVFWESGRNADFVLEFLKRQRDVAGVQRPELADWIARFEKDRREAGLDFWYEMHKGAHESLLEF